MNETAVSTLLDICKIAYAAEDLPNDLMVKGHPIPKDLMLNNDILNPVLLIMANKLHMIACATNLVELDGSVKRDLKAPFGVVVEGDINMNRLNCSIGVVLTYFCAAARLIKRNLVADDLECVFMYWSRDVFDKYKQGEVLSLSQLNELPLASIFHTKAVLTKQSA